ncbi:hypothetical protein GIB67_018834 [Kingdonia uniflora]|uniref:Uncharacterized protein n=1 Tax=Kingdonia uniflora TaxID=39325 RepID=A0A7J7NEG7_9MAGN|nr:hypothetical protein GIB67_018834 [Kingdonia uniflora]
MGLLWSVCCYTRGNLLVFNHERVITSSLIRAVIESFLRLLSKLKGEQKLLVSGKEFILSSMSIFVVRNTHISPFVDIPCLLPRIASSLTAPSLIASLPPSLHFALLPLLRTVYSSKWAFLEFEECRMNEVVSHSSVNDANLIFGVRNVPTEDVHVDDFTLLDRMLYKYPSNGKWEEHECNGVTVDVTFKITTSKAEKIKQYKCPS